MGTFAIFAFYLFCCLFYGLFMLFFKFLALCYFSGQSSQVSLGLRVGV